MSASAPAASTTWVMPEMVSGLRCPCQAGPGWRPRPSSQAETRFRGAPGQRDEADLVALAVQADLAGAGGDREVIGVQAGAFLDPRADVQQHGDDRGVAGSAADGRAADRALLPGSQGVGPPGLGMRAPSTTMRMPACWYNSVTAASAWLTFDGLDLAVIMCRRQAVTTPLAPTRLANASP